MLITKEIEVDTAHRVPNHKSKCQNFHGHRYVVEVGVDDKVIEEEGRSDEGMVIDFSDLKQIMMEEIDGNLDHNGIFYMNDPAKEFIEGLQAHQKKEILFVPFIPTAENIAKWIYKKVEIPLRHRKIKIKHVKIWETPSSTALYEE